MGVSAPTKSTLIAPFPGVVVVTTRETAAVCLRDPLVPVIVRVNVPVGVVLAVVTVIVEEPEPVTEVGLKVALAPDGSPLALKVTAPANPFTAAIVAV
jgi:hypothetical protein